MKKKIFAAFALCTVLISAMTMVAACGPGQLFGPPLIPTLTLTLTPTKTPVPTRTSPPIPTPTPQTGIVWWPDVKVYELPSANSEPLSLDPLKVEEQVEIIRFCQTTIGETWLLIYFPNKDDNYGWIKAASLEGSDWVLLDGDRRPITMEGALYEDLEIPCPGKYTPVPGVEE